MSTVDFDRLASNLHPVAHLADKLRPIREAGLIPDDTLAALRAKVAEVVNAELDNPAPAASYLVIDGAVVHRLADFGLLVQHVQGKYRDQLPNVAGVLHCDVQRAKPGEIVCLTFPFSASCGIVIMVVLDAWFRYD